MIVSDALRCHSRENGNPDAVPAKAPDGCSGFPASSAGQACLRRNDKPEERQPNL